MLKQTLRSNARRCALGLLVLAWNTSAGATPQEERASLPAETLWQDVDLGALDSPLARGIAPGRARTLRLDTEALRWLLAQAPPEAAGDEARSAGRRPLLALPLPGGGFASFQVEETAILHPELAEKFPEIRTYRGAGVDDRGAVAHLDFTVHGFHALVLSPAGAFFVDPLAQGDLEHYVAYFERDYVGAAERRMECGVSAASPVRVGRPGAEAVLAGETRRTYRAAVAATGEYTAFHGGTVSAGLSAITTSMNRVSGIYERDFAVRMQLVANNNLIVYTNASTDPYTNGSGSTMLGQNQSNLDAVIGSANYDIGHVFSTGGGGVAGLAVVCRAGNKARGVTGNAAPVGDPFDVDYVAHEMGHQFGGDHTFNGTTGSCSGNRVSSSAYEPGSGSTIMAYAGICGAEDLQPHSDDSFHTRSLDQISAYLAGTGGSCPATTATGNTPPTADAGPAFNIPAQTPFALTATASDANGDTLSYAWEQFNLGTASPPNTDNGTRPIFRSFALTSSPTRTFPRLSDILSNTATLGESLPTTTRTLTFRVTARDNRAGGGGYATDSTTLSVSAGAGPFAVTSPNTAVSWPAESTQTVTWAVANTNATPISAANVRILLSTDGGNTFGTVLAASTPNDGSQAIVVPNTATAQARVKVEALGNVFFDISNANFTIGGGGGGPVTVTFTSAGASDGRTWESTETSNVGGGSSATTTGADAIRVGDLTSDRQYRSIVSFDTSSIPDTATVTAATLRLVRGTSSGTNPFTTHGTCQVDIVTGAFGGSTTLASSDFQAAATATAVGSLSNPTANGAESTATLNAAGLSAINRTGVTQLKLYFTLDDNDDNGYDYIGFYPGENATAANRPTLTVTYQP